MSNHLSPSDRYASALHIPLFSFTVTPTPNIYTLSLHDALPISSSGILQKLDGVVDAREVDGSHVLDRKSTRLNSSHVAISYAVFCLKKKKRRLLRRSVLALL